MGLGCAVNNPKIIDLKDLLLEELTTLVEGWGYESYRAGQIVSWIHVRGTNDLDTMTDLSKSLRDQLKKSARISALALNSSAQSTADEATKFLFRLEDGLHVESVMMRDKTRVTACLSSQVGCPLGCTFCATARMGFVRNLRPAEIIDQLIRMQQHMPDGRRVTNVVMMGMGEPLLNYDALVKSLRIMRQVKGLGIGGRKTTVSTAGYVPGIRKLAREGLNVGLAISLNATADAQRSRLMPINRKFGIEQLLDAAGEYFDLTGRRVTFEYVLIEGLTDSNADAKRLATISTRIPCKINLIPFNKFDPTDVLRRPDRNLVKRFQEIVSRANRASVTVRESKGKDVLAACGQLYHENRKILTNSRSRGVAECSSEDI